ncbi:AAA family ATPase [Labedella populi]
MRPLVLSGGPAAGKSTCGRRLAEEHARAAFIDADDIRQLVVAGGATLWSGPDGRDQHLLGVRNVAALARNLAAVGFVITVADVVTEEALAAYRAELPDCLVVHLSLPLEEARNRAATRPVYLTDDEFDYLHDLLSSPPEVDVVVDVTGLTVDEQTDAIRRAWTSASLSGRTA